jgi:hypothetical protein
LDSELNINGIVCNFRKRRARFNIFSLYNEEVIWPLLTEKEDIMKTTMVQTKQDFLKYLEEIGAKYEVIEKGGIDFAYVYDKKAYTKKRDFVPYIRVSHFDDHEWYVRDCGICEEMDPECVCLRAGHLTRG